MLREAGRPAEALAAHEAALAIRRRWPTPTPPSPFQRDLANSLNETGDVLRLIGRTAEAQASYERALAILEGLVKADPTVTENQRRG